MKLDLLGNVVALGNVLGLVVLGLVVLGILVDLALDHLPLPGGRTAGLAAWVALGITGILGLLAPVGALVVLVLVLALLLVLPLDRIPLALALLDGGAASGP